MDNFFNESDIRYIHIAYYFVFLPTKLHFSYLAAAIPEPK